MAAIILIDDDPIVLKLVRAMLVKAGHEVREASSGDEGIRLFNERKADLVITDIIMPDKDGMETIIEIRRKAREVKIIAISGGAGFAPEHYLDTAQLFGAHRIIKKPFTFDELVAVVDDVLG
ncbi:MAG: response regulator [Pseudomonadota bacterium]